MRASRCDGMASPHGRPWCGDVGQLHPQQLGTSARQHQSAELPRIGRDHIARLRCCRGDLAIPCLCVWAADGQALDTWVGGGAFSHAQS